MIERSSLSGKLKVIIESLIQTRQTLLNNNGTVIVKKS